MHPETIHAHTQSQSTIMLEAFIQGIPGGIWAVTADRLGEQRCDMLTLAFSVAPLVSSTCGIVQRDVRTLWRWCFVLS